MVNALLYGNYARVKKLVQEVLNECPLLTIRRFFQRAFRHISGYRLGATGKVVEFTIRKFRSYLRLRMADLKQEEEKRRRLPWCRGGATRFVWRA